MGRNTILRDLGFDYGGNPDIRNTLERVHLVNDHGLSRGLTIDLNEIDRSFNLGLSAINKTDAVIGTDFDDTITGSARNEIIDGDDGNDILNGNGGDDLLVTSVGDRERIDGGEGIDTVIIPGSFNDYTITKLPDSDAYEFLLEDTNTNSQIRLKNVELGLFNDQFYDFTVLNGPFAQESEEITDTSGNSLGVITLEAPATSCDTEVEFNLNISTSGLGIQYKFALIIDVSGSMEGGRLTQARAAYRDLIQYLEDQGLADAAEFAVIPFSTSAQLWDGLSADEARRIISSLSADGATNFSAALREAIDFFGSVTPGITNIAYFLSDGEDNRETASRPSLSQELQRLADVRAFGIGQADINVLNQVDSNNAVFLNSISQLADSFVASEIQLNDVDRIEIILNGRVVQTIFGSDLMDDGAAGLTYDGMVSGLDPQNSDTLEARVYFTSNSVSPHTVTFTIGDGMTEATGTNGNDEIVFSLTQVGVDAGDGTDTIIANDLDNQIIKRIGDGIIIAGGGNDVIDAGDNSGAGGMSRVIDGGPGVDVVRYIGNAINYVIQRVGDLIQIGLGTDSLSNVEFLQFNDMRIQTSKIPQGITNPMMILTAAAVQTLTIADAAVTESDENQILTFTVSLDEASSRDVTFSFETVEGTAERDDDYIHVSGTQTLLAGQTEIAINVVIVGDVLFEEEEIFFLQLSNLDGAVFTDDEPVATGRATIRNDDDPDRIETGTLGDDTVTAGKGDDQINTRAGDDIVNAGIGDDLIVDGLGNDELNGQGGNDLVIALSGINTLRGGEGNDYLAGGYQRDYLIGNAGNDILRGDPGTNFLTAGLDVLDGGPGDDILMGGRGADIFIFNPGDGSDVIGGFDQYAIVSSPSGYSVSVTRSDFEPGNDVIRLQNFTTVTESNVMSYIQDQNDNAVFNAENTSITFFGITTNLLDENDFLFV